MSINFARWTDDFSCQKIMKNDYAKYINQFDDKEVDMITSLMEKMEFYDSVKCEKLFNNYKDFISEIAQKYKDAYFFLPNTDDEPHNSYRLFSKFKNLNKRFGNKFHGNYFTKKGVNDFYFESANPIVIMDDYCGSGGTINKMLKFINNKLNKKTEVIIAPMFITHYAIENLNNDIPNYNNLIISFSYANEIRNALYLTQQKILTEEQLELLEIVSADNHLNYAHGFNNTEELLAFSHYTPNNTIGILWENSCFHIPFLNRDDNSFINEISDNLYFSHKNIDNLKRCIKQTEDYGKWRRSAFAILYMLDYPKEQIWTNLKFDTEENYKSFEKSIFTNRILRRNKLGVIERGPNFKKYINDELFTRLVYLDDNKTRYRLIDEKLTNCTK